MQPTFFAFEKNQIKEVYDLFADKEKLSDLEMPLHITVGSFMVSKSSVRVLNFDVLYVSILKISYV